MEVSGNGTEWILPTGRNPMEGNGNKEWDGMEMDMVVWHGTHYRNVNARGINAWRYSE